MNEHTQIPGPADRPNGNAYRTLVELMGMSLVDEADQAKGVLRRCREFLEPGFEAVMVQMLAAALQPMPDVPRRERYGVYRKLVALVAIARASRACGTDSAFDRCLQHNRRFLETYAPEYMERFDQLVALPPWEDLPAPGR